MKYTIKETVEKEVEIEFPLYFKNGRTYSYCKNEHSSIVIYPTMGQFSYYATKLVLPDLERGELCTREEVEAAFNKVVSDTRKEFEFRNITIDMNDNTPSELLESL